MEFTTKLLIESWILYALGVLLVTCRMVSRRMKLEKWRNLMIDDYLMLFAFVNFTGVVVSINEVAKNGSNYMSPEEAAALTPEEVDDAVYGSIMTFVLEIFTLTSTWTVKTCLLILYGRLTRHALTRQHLLVKITAGYCGFTYVLVMLLLIFYWCHPTYEYWAVPVRIEQCATYYNHMIFATACNISSDILLLFIPIPIILKTRLPKKRKIILSCILGLGVLNILAAILNRYYNFSNPNSYVFLYWYVAEVGIGMLVGNMPLCWPVLRAMFGVRDKTDTPAYRGQTISGGGRKHKKPKSMLNTSVLGTTLWDKLDDQEEGVAAPKRSHEDQLPSDQGSQIELILQGHANNHHLAAVSANADLSSTQAQPASNPTESGNGDQRNEVTGDKIIVVTTVDVSSSDTHK